MCSNEAKGMLAAKSTGIIETFFRISVTKPVLPWLMSEIPKGFLSILKNPIRIFGTPEILPEFLSVLRKAKLF